MPRQISWYQSVPAGLVVVVAIDSLQPARTALSSPGRRSNRAAVALPVHMGAMHIRGTIGDTIGGDGKLPVTGRQIGPMERVVTGSRWGNMPPCASLSSFSSAQCNWTPRMTDGSARPGSGTGVVAITPNCGREGAPWPTSPSCCWVWYTAIEVRRAGGAGHPDQSLEAGSSALGACAANLGCVAGSNRLVPSAAAAARL